MHFSFFSLLPGKEKSKDEQTRSRKRSREKNEETKLLLLQKIEYVFLGSFDAFQFHKICIQWF